MLQSSDNGLGNIFYNWINDAVKDTEGQWGIILMRIN